VGPIAVAEPVSASETDDLIHRAALGDARAYDELMTSRLDRCFRLAFSIVGNRADAADATQEAVVSAWRQLPRLRDQRAFDGWLNRIVVNSARMSRRHRVRLREVPVDPAADEDGTLTHRDRPDHGAGTDIDRIASADTIGRSFARLKDEDRMLLVLHHVEERPLAEISRSLGIPVGTVKWRLHRARNALERAMEAEA
jgi:RNA polymerase sigma-70 factor (ECF subfamily)